jgi:hypothetical protein
MRNTLIIAVAACVLSLVGIVGWAQVPVPGVPGPGEARRPALGHESAVLSGDEIGIRLTGSIDANGRVQGTLVAKIGGKWVDVVGPTAVVR